MKSTISKNIPLSAPHLAGNEWNYIKSCLDTNWVSSVGSFVNEFEQKVATFTGAKYAVATSNGTTALHISLLLADIKAEDYVIVPNITFIASVNAIKYTGANPILIDVDPKNWQMDLVILEEFLQENTEIINSQCVYKQNRKIIKAIMPVHVLGNMCDMDKLVEIAKKYHLVIIEDSTEALGSYYKNKHAGTFGLIGCFSFNGNKIITTGGGGMLVTDDETIAKRAKHLTTQAKSDSFEYVHDEVGYNYRLVNILAAMGVAQMEQLEGFLTIKKENAAIYRQTLTTLGDIAFQEILPDVQPNNWLLTIATSKQKLLLKKLNELNIQCRPLWKPMNQLDMFKNDIFVSKNNTADQLYQTCISLPSSSSLTQEEVLYICETIKSIIHSNE